MYKQIKEKGERIMIWEVRSLFEKKEDSSVIEQCEKSQKVLEQPQ